MPDPPFTSVPQFPPCPFSPICDGVYVVACARGAIVTNDTRMKRARRVACLSVMLVSDSEGLRLADARAGDAIESRFGSACLGDEGV